MSDDPLKNLSPRKRKYVKARASGKSKKVAGLQAGFSESMAENAKARIETEDVLQAFQKLIRSKIPAQKIVDRINEGMDAQETKFFQKDGLVTDSRDVIAFGERRAYTALAAEYGGYFTPEMQLAGKDGGPIVFKLERIGKK